MTLLTTWIGFIPPRLLDLAAPEDFRCADVSVIVPVRDNQAGIERFLAALLAGQTPETLPREVIIVDNRSAVPVRIPAGMHGRGVRIRLLRCDRIGPASARNEGAAAADGRWLLFSDSDCEPAPGFLSGFGSAMNGAVGYAGYVRALGRDRLSRYYESQEILIPPRVRSEHPQYLITANALVWKEAFERVGGFDERYPRAGGEDVDLGFRLAQVGSLEYAPESLVLHDFGDGYRGFVRRFVRYGEGNRRLARHYAIDLRPRPFAPAGASAHNWIAAAAQFACLAWGYWTARGPAGVPRAAPAAVHHARSQACHPPPVR